MTVARHEPSSHQVTYLINAYKQPELLLRIVDRLSGPATSFIVHVDRKSAACDAALEALSRRSDVTLLSRRRIYWGGSQLLDVFLAGLNKAVEDPREDGHVVYLTGQDYPLWSASRIQGHLARHADRSFVNHVAVPREDWLEGGLWRFQYFHHSGRRGHWQWPGPSPGRSKLLAAVWTRTARPGFARQLPDGLVPHGGSGVWALSKRDTRRVLDLCRQRPEIPRFFRWVFAPDEMFFQTVLMSGPSGATVVNDDLHYTVWDANTAHPVTFGVEDEGDLIPGPAPFARKFDLDHDSAILSLIDQHIDAEVR
jgi:hypothetical protein